MLRIAPRVLVRSRPAVPQNLLVGTTFRNPGRYLGSAAFASSRRSSEGRQQKRQQNSKGGWHDNNRNSGRFQAGNERNSGKFQARKDPKSDGNKLIRLTKRMSELDICSRREAERFIEEGRVLLKGQRVEPKQGIKVSPQETDIVLLRDGKGEEVEEIRANEFSWTSLQTAAVVLHKPEGFISGQPEKDFKDPEAYTPAVRLLTPSNAHILRSNYQDSEEFQEAKRIVQSDLDFAMFHRDSQEPTLQNYVPAGRLDKDSSGLIIFTNQGVVAKKLVANQSKLEKEYWIVLEPIQFLTKGERAQGMTDIKQLPQPTRDLKPIRRGGYTLLGDSRPLRPVVEAEWLRWEDQISIAALEANARRRLLRIVMKEGRKHQIRRMCREILGMHVVQLVRNRIGPIRLDPQSLPEGRWRPLRLQEVESIFAV